MSEVRIEVTVILVTYNSGGVILDALASIPAHYPVIVVDNASTDNTVDLIRQSFPGVEVLVNQQNLGFGRANNLGIDHAHTPFVLLMNPDARLLDDATIDQLRTFADKYPTASILSPVILDAEGVRQMNLPAPILNRRKENKRFNMGMVAGEVCAYALSGAMMLIRKSAFEGQPHYFDPNIFMYFEDDDICIEANRRGYTTMLIPQVEVLHHAGQSSGPSLEVEALKAKHKTCSRLYILRKHESVARAARSAAKLLCKYSVSVVGYALTGKSAKLKISASRLMGVLMYLSGRYRAINAE